MTALASGGAGMTAAATAHADPGPIGPRQWCPGQSLWITGNHVTNPVIWDNNICHTYYIVDFGQGNVAQNIWDGPDPPAAIPPRRHRRGPSPPASSASRSSGCSAPRRDLREHRLTR